MLKGSWIINVVSASFAFIIVFSASFYQNLLSTTFIRGAIAFVVIFLLAYLFRWLAFLAFFSEEKPDFTENEVELTEDEELPLEDLAIQNEELQLSEEDVLKTSQYVKELLDNEEG